MTLTVINKLRNFHFYSNTPSNVFLIILLILKVSLGITHSFEVSSPIRIFDQKSCTIFYKRTVNLFTKVMDLSFWPQNG